nr:Mu transposase C-terminal domain-containing protein [uncultured Desulfobulbus sp.]
MKQWYKPIELAGLPGMPSAPQSVSRRARKEHWMARYRQGQGGGKEYHLSSLPAETQAALHFQYAPPPAKDKDLVIKEKTDQKLSSLKGWQREIFDARVTLFREFEKLQKLHGTNRAVDALVDLAKEQALPEHLMHCVTLANARKGQVRALSRSLVLGWQRSVRRYGIIALAPKPMEKAGIPEWAGFFIQCYQKPSNPTIPEAMEQMTKILPEGMTMPSYHQVLRFHNKRSRLEREKGRKTGAAYQALKGYWQRDTSGYRPMTIGCCDGHSYKAKVAHPVHGRPFHPEVCAIIDVATKVVTGWSAGLAESALTVAGAIRDAAMVSESKPYGGIFGIVYTDGGSGNMAGVNTDDKTGLFARIGTTFTKGRPGNPQGHGVIERPNRTMWIRSAKQLATFTGKEMDKSTKRNLYIVMQRDIEKKGTSEHLISWPQFLEFCQDTVDTYNRRPHSSLPKINDPETGRKRHMTPLECWAWHVTDGWDPRECQLTEAEVEILWLPRVERKVVRSMVQLSNNHYFNADLAHIEGQSVQVAYFPNDATKVQIYDQEGRLYCYAMFEKNRVDFFPKPMVEQAQEKRTKRREAIKQQQLDLIREECNGIIDITPGPRPKCEVLQLFPASEDRSELKDARDKLALEMNKPEPFVIPANDRDMFRLWRELDGRMRGGEVLEERAVRFYESFRNSATYRTFVEVEEQLGVRQG